MVVKRVQPIGVNKPVRPVARQVTKPTPVITLPTERKEPDRDFQHYTILIYGQPKIGKTTVANSFPSAIFFSTEPGTRGLSCYALNAEDGGVRNWDIFRQGVDLLVKAGPKQFKTVIIDTAGRAYDLCLDWVCENRGIEYPGVASDGKEDYGKSWRAVKEEFTSQIYRLLQTGFGVVFLAHAKEEEIVSRSNTRFHRIYPNLSAQARTVIESLVDFFFYCEYVKLADGSNARIFICEGDELVWAGARNVPPPEGEIIGNPFPRYIPMLRINGYEVLAKAFRGEYQGLNPQDIYPNQATAASGKEFLTRESLKAKRSLTFEKDITKGVKPVPQKIK